MNKSGVVSGLIKINAGAGFRGCTLLIKYTFRPLSKPGYI